MNVSDYLCRHKRSNRNWSHFHGRPHLPVHLKRVHPANCEIVVHIRSSDHCVPSPTWWGRTWRLEGGATAPYSSSWSTRTERSNQNKWALVRFPASTLRYRELAHQIPHLGSTAPDWWVLWPVFTRLILYLFHPFKPTNFFRHTCYAQIPTTLRPTLGDLMSIAKTARSH